MIDTVVFDLGGVLINWDPRNLYRKVMSDAEQVETFLEEVCTFDWNAQQDAGRPLAEATQLLVDQYPNHESHIRMYYDRWEEMLDGSIQETVALLDEIKQNQKYRLLALTNWSHETFPRALELFDFLHWFEGIVVSGEEQLKKPDERLYKVLFDRYQLSPERAVFIDDSHPNVVAAQDLGMKAIHFQGPELLRTELAHLQII